MLKCSKCGFDKPDDEFPGNRRAVNRRGRFHVCKKCNHDYYLANKERHLRTTRANGIRSRYGLSVGEYDEIIARGCGICGTKATTRIVMDHCHTSGKVRESLCNQCNVLLGTASDDPDILREAIAYLERHAES